MSVHTIIIRINIVSIGTHVNNPDNVDLCFKRATEEVKKLFPEFEPDEPYEWILQKKNKEI